MGRLRAIRKEMSTAELSVIACLCLMLISSGIGRKPRVRVSGFGHVHARSLERHA